MKLLFKQRLFSWFDSYDIYDEAGNTAFVVKGELEWDYNIRDCTGRYIACVSKEIWNWTDTYVLDVQDPQDALYVLMLVLAIDAEKCSRND